MNFTNEMIRKGRRETSVEELLAIARAEGVELSEKDAEKFFSFFTGGVELPDEALAAVAGGKGGSSQPSPKFKPGQSLFGYYSTSCSWVCMVIISYELLNGKVYRYTYHEYGFRVNDGHRSGLEDRGVRDGFPEQMLGDYQTKDPCPLDPPLLP